MKLATLSADPVDSHNKWLKDVVVSLLHTLEHGFVGLHALEAILPKMLLVKLLVLAWLDTTDTLVA